MQTQIIKKIKKIRIEMGFSPQIMAEKLNIDLSAYTRLESGRTFTWGKYLEDILIIFNISPEIFFKEINIKKVVSSNRKSTEDINFESLYFESKEQIKKVESLYEGRLKDKDQIIEHLKETYSKKSN